MPSRSSACAPRRSARGSSANCRAPACRTIESLERLSIGCGLGAQAACLLVSRRRSHAGETPALPGHTQLKSALTCKRREALQRLRTFGNRLFFCIFRYAANLSAYCDLVALVLLCASAAPS